MNTRYEMLTRILAHAEQDEGQLVITRNGPDEWLVHYTWGYEGAGSTLPAGSSHAAAATLDAALTRVQDEAGLTRDAL